VEQFIRAIAEFDASHTDGTRVRCQRNHGHHWTITAEKRVAGEADLEVDLHAIIAEWQDRDLNEMLHAKDVDVVQVAAWTAERLLLAHPTLVRVTAGDGRLLGITTRELRR
jgi:6-pyruvoyl-tetrahydropterin synthase